MQYINAQLEVLYNNPIRTFGIATSTYYDVDNKSDENSIQAFVVAHKDNINFKYAIREMHKLKDNMLECAVSQYFDTISNTEVHSIDGLTPMHVYAVSIVDDTSINSTTKIVSKLN